MSKNVDQRVVEMQFDNKQFESGIQTSLKSLDNLKKGLNLEESAKSLSNLEKAGKSFSLAGIASGVEAISNKFSALGIIGVTALQNITNSAVNAGKRIVSSLTIDPVKMGFQEYETQINAVQTILANTESKGKTLTDVNKALDELNAYADKTIYNFTEMTRNIGTFTAAGVDLDTSVSAIKGIANLAAVSGSTSQQASTAMYQLSQALASGTVKLMDWNSVVNAGMGGQVFQDALKETARVHGVAIDDMIESEGSFRETLSKGWLSAEILTETLSKFTGDLNEEQLKSMGYTQEQIAGIMKMGKTANDAATKVKTFTQLIDTLKEAAQSGWTQTWEIVVGDFEEAKVLLTEVSDTIGAMIGKSAEARNEMLKGWKELGGRTSLIESFRNVFQGVMSVITPIKEAFREIFPAMTAERLYNITEALRKLTERFKIGETTANNLKRTFKGVFSVISIGVQVVSAIAKGIGKLIGYLTPAGNGILALTGYLGDCVSGLNSFLKSSDIFNVIIQKIVGVLGAIITGIKNFVSAIGNAIKGFVNIDMSGVDSFTEGLRKRFQPLTALGEGIKKFFDFVVAVIKKVAPVFVALGQIIGKALGGLFDILARAVSNADFNTILDLINGGLLVNLILGLNKFVGSLGSIKDMFNDVFDDVKGVISGVKEIFDGVIGSLKAFQSNLKANTLLKIAGAIAILTVALVVLSKIGSKELTTALTAISTLFIELFASMAIFEKLMGSKGFKSLTKITLSMLGLSTAVLILSFAMKKLSSLDWKGIASGLTGVAGISAILVTSANHINKNVKKLRKSAIGLIGFAAAVLILSSAVEKLGDLNAGQLTKGLIGVGVLCAELAMFLKVADFDGVGLKKGLGLMALAGAINMLASAVDKIGHLDWQSLVKGLGAVAVILLELGIFTKAISGSTKILSTSVGLVVLGAAMLIFAEALEKIGSLSLDQLSIGLRGMAAALLIVGVAITALPKGMLGKATGLVVAASSLLILAGVLKIFGNMGIAEIGKALLTLTVSLGALAGAMYLMQYGVVGAGAMMLMALALGMLVPSLLIMSLIPFGTICKGMFKLMGAFALFGLVATLELIFVPAVLAMGAALNVLGAGLVAVGLGVLAFSAGMTMLSVAGTVGMAGLTAIVTGLIGLIPTIIKKIGEGIIAFAKIIGDSAVVIAEAIAKVVIAILNALTNAIPPLMQCLGTLLSALLEFIVSYIPQIVDAGMKLIMGLLEGIANNIPGIVAAAVDIIVAFLESIGSQLPRIVSAGFMLIINFINGMADSIRTNSSLLMDAIRNLVNAMFEAMGNVVSGGISIGKDLISGLIKGVKNKATDLFNSVVGTVKNAWNGVKDFLGIRSPSRLAAEAGMYIDEGLAIGLKQYADVAGDAALGVGEQTMDGLKYAMQKVSDVVNSDIDAAPSIRPVVDMSNIDVPNTNTWNDALDSLSYKANKLNSEISTESHTTVNHTFGTLKVEGVNNEGEFVAAADYAVEEVLTELMRRQNRL